MKYYTGVGSRDTPEHILHIIKQAAAALSRQEYILRSGGADGADKAFADGWWMGLLNCGFTTRAEIYLPWNKFNNMMKSEALPVAHIPSEYDNYAEAEKIASEIHPIWDNLKPAVKKLHARNVYQVLGKDLNTPSQFLLCYAPIQGDSVKGGTRTAWEVAKRYGVRCFNLANEKDLKRVEDWLV